MKAPYTLTLGDADCRIEISVRFARAQAPTSIAISGSMTPQAVPSVVPPHDGAAVLGRIDAPATRLESLIESWIQHMQARNCAPGTVAIWPRADEISTMKRARKKNEIKRLTSMDDPGHDYSVEATSTCTSPPATSRPPPLGHPPVHAPASTPAMTESRGSSCCTSGAFALPTLDSDQRFEPESGRFQPESAHLKMGATARLLRALADLIESGRAAPVEGTADELRNAGRVA